MKRAVACIGAIAIAACGVDDLVLRDLASASDAGADGGTVLFDGGVHGTAFGAFGGQDFSCALVQGAGFCWGNNVQGALGSGDRQSALVPAPIAGATTFDQLALGEAHSCGLEHGTGRVLCWGYNANGQLGLGDTATRMTPEAVTLPGPAVSVTVGYDHSCAALVDGTLYCWGANAEGQLGLGDVFGAPDSPSPKRVGTDSDWMLVAGGQGHSCGVRRPGAVYCWGRNTDGELGVGGGMPIQLRAPARAGTFDDYVMIDLGQAQSCGVRAGGSIQCWGDRRNGNLVDPANGPQLNVPTAVDGATDWASVSTDEFTTCGIKKNGALYCWGRNAEGELGVGDNADRTSPTLTGDGHVWASVGVGRFHVCAQTTDHAVYCTGDDGNGELGQNDLARRNTLSAVPLPGFH